MDLIDVEGATGGIDTDLESITKSILDTANSNDYDFILINIDGADEAGHDGEMGEKLKFIEKVDSVIGEIMKIDDIYFILTADHATPISIMDHTGDPVPIIIKGPEIRVDEVNKFNERAAASGGLCRIRGADVMNILMDLMNKSEKFAGEHYEFFSLGLGEPFPVSAAHGLNTGDLLDEILVLLPEQKEEEDLGELVKIAIVGRPNVGKSSLVNRILGFERAIVSDLPGTTRDTVHTLFKHEGHDFMLIDTAGIRRKSKIDVATDRYSVMRSLRAIDICDLALIMVDASEGVTNQDKRIAGYVHEKGKASILVVNKWDLVPKDARTAAQYREKVYQELPFLSYAPVAFVSALTGTRVLRLLHLVLEVWEEYGRKISTSPLNDLLADIQLRHLPPSYKGKRLKIFYGTQVGSRPPTFALFVNDPDLVHFSYLRHLENQLRQAFHFKTTPLRLLLRKRREN